MSAGFADLLSALGIWAGGRKQSAPPLPSGVAAAVVMEWPLNTVAAELPSASTEQLAAAQTQVTHLASAATEVPASLNVVIQETAMLR